NPSLTARLPIKEESAAVQRILGELTTLDPGHPLRVAYEASLLDSEKLVQDAGQKSDEAVTELALQRSHTERFKHGLDKGRLEVHGRLVAVLKDKDEADGFYRPTSSAPGEEPKKETAATPAPAGP